MITAVSAEVESNQKIIFISKAHEEFYYQKMEQIRYKDCYHLALIYTLGINADTRLHCDEIYDFKAGYINPKCIDKGWQTSGSLRVVHLAFNLYCSGAPTVERLRRVSDKCMEYEQYTVDDIFCCGYAPFFWQAIKIRYPEYSTYNNLQAELYGSRD